LRELAGRFAYWREQAFSRLQDWLRNLRGWLKDLREWFRGLRVAVLAGVGVVAAGVVCLYLSGEVARPGSWWQNTLDAFGVGFVVGGLIDVIAISGLNQILAGDQQRRELTREADDIFWGMASGKFGDGTELAKAARDLLNRGGEQLDSTSRYWMDIFTAADGMEYVGKQGHEDRPPAAQDPPASMPDQDDGPTAPADH
jgi:hypothetical protein